MNFIEKLEFTADLKQMQEDLNELLKKRPWPEEDIKKKLPGGQLGVTYRPGAKDIWLDASGSLYNKETNTFEGKESDFTEINPLIGSYTKEVLKELSKHTKKQFGRIRYMRALSKRGLSIHKDFEQRYHFVLQTNPGALFGETVNEDGLAAKCYHIPADGHFYKVDTTRDHFIYNGGWEERIHLVICEV